MRRVLPFLLFSSLCFAACDKKEEKKDDKKEESKKDDKKDEKEEKKEEGITFKGKAPAVGDKFDEKKASDMKMTITIEVGAKKTSEFTEVENSHKTVEALAVDGKAITKAKITYSEYKKIETEDGKEKKKPPSPLGGKTFLFELKDGKVLVTDEKGGKLPKDEETKVLAKNRHFGKPDPFLEGMPDKPLKPGDKVDSMVKALEQYFKDDDDSAKDPPEIKDVKVKLDSIEKDGKDQIGVFSVEMTMASPKDNKSPVDLKIPLKGKVKVRAKDGFTTSIDLEGPVTMESNDAKFKMSGKGKAHMNITQTK
ncbi:MAG: hypothetical protein JNL79_33065 [Myxococcales bacterium]|nr:hypothetical protein [Myxococcales bacterium]